MTTGPPVPAPRTVPPDLPTPPVAASTVLVTSHDPRVREVLLAHLAGARVAHEAATVGEAVLASRCWGPGELAVVDLSLPEAGAVALVADLRADGWGSVLVLAARDRVRDALDAVGAGAHGVLVSPGASPATPVPAGPAPLTPVPLTPVPLTPVPAEAAGLTVRERRVLTLVAEGASNRQVADRLAVSPFTVKAHLARIGDKLGTGDRAAMVLLALRAGLIS